jgi:hypothetical protein
MQNGSGRRVSAISCDRSWALMMSRPLVPKPVWVVQTTTELRTATAVKREQPSSVGSIPTAGSTIIPVPIGVALIEGQSH